MSFISLDFLLFAPLVVLLYQLCAARHRALLLLAASYVFYAWWSLHYIGLIVLSSTVAYLSARNIESATSQTMRKRWLWFSVVVILGQLFYFKYFNFFLYTLNQAVGSELPLLSILLPVGISFFSLQTIGYVIDVYRGKFKAETGLTPFFLYVCFYPQLVAGPIERAGRLLPQLQAFAPITRANLRAGLVHIAYGLALKLIAGDRLGLAAAGLFDRPEAHSSPEVLLATFFQLAHIYCDFFGYSEMARGLAMIFGIQLMRNFENPLLAANARIFWQRWHVSLTRWIFDYLYSPLVGRKASQLRRTLCLVLTMLIIGLWHGASYNFILFGLYHALLMLTQDKLQEITPWKFPRWIAVPINMAFISLSSILFMSRDLEHARAVVVAMFSGSFTGALSMWEGANTPTAVAAFLLLLFVETRYRGADMLAQRISSFNTAKRWVLYLAMVLTILSFGLLSENDFVYFRF